MNLNLDDVQHRIRTDQHFKKRVKKIVIFAAIGLLLIVILAITTIVIFSSAIIGFVYTHAPAAYEFVFNNAREFAASFMLNDINALMPSMAQNPNVAEFKNLVTQYFEQLRTNPAIGFHDFQGFVSTVKGSLADNQITNAELDVVRNFLIK